MVWQAALLSFGIAVVTFVVTWTIAVDHPAFGIFASLLPAFLITVLVEYPLWLNRAERRQALRGVLCANGASYLLLIAVLILADVRATETPLITPDFYILQATAAASDGDFDKAIRRLDLARSVHSRPGTLFQRQAPRRHDYRNYYPRGDRNVAVAMIRQGEYALAQSLLQEALQLPGLDPEYAEMCDLQKLLDQCESALAGKGQARQ